MPNLHLPYSLSPFMKFYVFIVLWLINLPVSATVFNVTSTSDAADINPGNGNCATASGVCTLRAAVEEANALSGADEIRLQASHYVLVQGALDINDSVRVMGSLTTNTTIDGDNTSGVFQVNGGISQSHIRVELHRLNITNGNSQNGAGVWSDNAVVLIQRCQIRNNDSFSYGGGIKNQTGSLMELVRSSVSNNGHLGDLRGGGIANSGVMIIRHSTIDNNQANRFGGILNQGWLVLQNSTISGNEGAIDTGGLANTGLAFMNNVTVTDNRGSVTEDAASSGLVGAGGIDNYNDSGTLYVANSIIAGNTKKHVSGNHVNANDCYGAFYSFGYNLIEDINGCNIQGDQLTNITNNSAALGSLANNGGGTQTHMPLAGSAVINAGNPAPADGVGAHCEPTDQRFIQRNGFAGRCDIGAVEIHGAVGGFFVLP